MNCPTARSCHPAIIEHWLERSVPLIFNFDSPSLSILTFNIVQNFIPNQSARIDVNEKKVWQGEEALNIEMNVRKIFIILLSEGLMANIDDSRGEEENNKSARHSGPALHTAGLPHGQHGAVARLQEEHQP